MSSFKKSTRREFLVAGSSAALATATASAAGAPGDPEVAATAALTAVPDAAATRFVRAAQRSFSGDSATQIAMPIGGIGAGSVCMSGSGGLEDFAIHERPATTALPAVWSSNSPQAAFAVLHV